MATKLFKLVLSATTTTEVTTNPEVAKYFYNLREDERTDGTITIPAAQFFDDEGNAVTGNLTTVTANNGYYLLFINGVQQQTSLYTVSGDGSQVVITEGETVPVDAPIILVVNNFDPTSSSTTVINT